MEPLWIGILGIVAFLVLIAAGVHIALAMAVVGVIGGSLIIGVDKALYFLVSSTFYKVYNMDFVVIPLFILVGLLAALGGISRDAYDSLSLWLNRVRGGLGIATVGGATMFGAITGSSLVTASVFAKVSAPDMRRRGYEKRLAYGIVTAAGSIGMLIPPSILIMVYAILTEESPGQLLMAGVVPGIFLFLIFSIGIWVMVRIKPSLVSGTQSIVNVTWRQRVFSLGRLWPIALVALIIVGGILSGFFSVIEAAGFAVVVVFIIVLFTRRSFKGIAAALSEAAAISGMVFFIFIGASVFSRFLSLSGIAPQVLELIIGLELSPLGLVIAMAGLYLVLGCFLDSISILAVTIPIIYPVVLAMGIDPIWYAMSVILALEAGFLTPPVGLNVYAVKGVAEADVSLEDIFWGSFPFFIMMVATLAIFIAFPALSTTLPNLMID